MNKEIINIVVDYVNVLDKQVHQVTNQLLEVQNKITQSTRKNLKDKTLEELQTAFKSKDLLQLKNIHLSSKLEQISTRRRTWINLMLKENWTDSIYKDHLEEILEYYEESEEYEKFSVIYDIIKNLF